MMRDYPTLFSEAEGLVDNLPTVNADQDIAKAQVLATLALAHAMDRVAIVSVESFRNER